MPRPVVSVFGPYREALRVPGAVAFSAAGFVARMPISMMALGIVLLISHTTGSYGSAGAVSAAFVSAHAVLAPLQARAADRIGQHRTLPPLLGAHSLGLVAFLTAAQRDAPLVVLLVTAALSGASFPQIGALVRARWAARLDGRPELHTAYALESVLDEAIFVVGPVLVTVLATQTHPVAGLLTALALAVSGGLLLASLRATEPTAHPRRPRATRARIPWRTTAPIAIGFLCLGAVFGSIDVTPVAVTTEWGQRHLAGVALAAFAVGSLVAGLVYGAIGWRSSPAVRFAWFLTLLAGVLLPLPFADSLPALMAAALLAGVAMSPTMVTGFALVQATVPRERLTEGLAWTVTSLGAGLAVGSALSGQVIDAAGAPGGFWVAAGAAGLGSILGWATRAPLVAAVAASAAGGDPEIS